MRIARGLLVLLAVFAQSMAAEEQRKTFFEDPEVIAQWMAENHVPALGIGIIRDGKLRQVKVYGELRNGEPAPYNTIFNVASLTKPVVTMLTLKLVSSGQWKLDEPLASYWVDPDVAADPTHAKLTTRHVLSHQTGFPNWRWMDESKKLRFQFEPGTKVQYSGEGFEYLRKALEKKFGKSLAELSQIHVFTPLGMADTQHAWDARTDESRFARWHDKDGKEAYPDYKTTRANAADDLLTTVEDYGNFAVAVLHGTGLSEALFQEMVKPQAVLKENRLAMGLGWELHQNLGDGEYALIHSGSDDGVRAVVMLLPKSGQGLVVMMNGDNGHQLYERLVLESLDRGKEIMGRAK
jgi:CubicO group peptidase (beta-lactamase class C family)